MEESYKIQGGVWDKICSVVSLEDNVDKKIFEIINRNNENCENIINAVSDDICNEIQTRIEGGLLPVINHKRDEMYEIRKIERFFIHNIECVYTVTFHLYHEKAFACNFHDNLLKSSDIYITYSDGKILCNNIIEVSTNYYFSTMKDKVKETLSKYIEQMLLFYYLVCEDKQNNNIVEEKVINNEALSYITSIRLMDSWGNRKRYEVSDYKDAYGGSLETAYQRLLITARYLMRVLNTHYIDKINVYKLLGDNKNITLESILISYLYNILTLFKKHDEEEYLDFHKKENEEKEEVCRICLVNDITKSNTLRDFEFDYDYSTRYKNVYCQIDDGLTEEDNPYDKNETNRDKLFMDYLNSDAEENKIYINPRHFLF